MRRFTGSSIEKSIYVLGLIGFLMLTSGMLVHMSCKGLMPCPYHKWERLSYYIGHACLLLAAFSYCVLPFLRKKERS